jgi:hypothetical protein
MFRLLNEDGTAVALAFEMLLLKRGYFHKNFSRLPAHGAGKVDGIGKE